MQRDRMIRRVRAAAALACTGLLYSLSALAVDEPATPAPVPVAAPAPASSPFEMITTASGLQYRDLIVGKGTVAVNGNSVSVHYTGWLQQPDGSRGAKFDSSRDSGTPLTFPLGKRKVIRGWDEGVAGMRIGGRRRLVVPSELAYGAKGGGDGVIPPFANLIFDVELLGVSNQ